MEMTDWITLAVFFSLGWWMGSKWTTLITVRAMMDIFRDLKITNKDLHRIARENGLTLPSKDSEESSDEDTLDQIDIKVEKHGEMLYAFRADNDAFLGQGTSRDELVNRMAEKLKNVRCTIVEGVEYMKSEA